MKSLSDISICDVEVSGQFMCGACDKMFDTICQVHLHISSHNSTGAYVFDPLFKVAFPRHDVTCAFTQTEDIMTQYFRDSEFLETFRYNRQLVKNGDTEAATDKPVDDSDMVIENYEQYLDEDTGDTVAAGQTGNMKELCTNSKERTELNRNLFDLKQKADLRQVSHPGVSEDQNEMDRKDFKKKLSKHIYKQKDCKYFGRMKKIRRKFMGKDREMLNKSGTSDEGKSVEVIDNSSVTDHQENEQDKCFGCSTESERKAFGKTNKQDKHSERPSEELSAIEVNKRTKGVVYDGRQQPDEKMPQNYFYGKISFGGFTISRPYVSDWDRGKCDENSMVQAVQTCSVPTEWTLLEPNDKQPFGNGPSDRNGVEWKNAGQGKAPVENFKGYRRKAESSENGASENESEKILLTVTRNKNMISQNGYACNLCGKVIKKKEHFEGHMNKHNGIKPYVCELCGISFYSKHYIEIHKKSTAHVSQTDYLKCDECGKTFHNKVSLNQHVRCTHASQGYNYQCRLCDKAFTCQAYLKRHMRIHTDKDREFKCEVCGKSYCVKSYLQEHKKTHYMTYKCEMCDKQFASYTSLMTHGKIHKAQKDHVCHICDKSFVQKMQYWIHMEKHHDLTKAQLMAMFPDKHLQKNLSHTQESFMEHAQSEESEEDV